MNNLNLNDLELKTFTEQDILDYCSINNIDSDNITALNLSGNKLTDISGIRLFKNLKHLYLAENKLENISVLKYLYNLKELVISDNPLKNISIIKDLKNIKYLSIQNLELESDQVQYVKSLKKLKELWCKNGFKNMSILKQLNKRVHIYE